MPHFFSSTDIILLYTALRFNHLLCDDTCSSRTLFDLRKDIPNTHILKFYGVKERDLQDVKESKTRLIAVSVWYVEVVVYRIKISESILEFLDSCKELDTCCNRCCNLITISRFLGQILDILMTSSLFSFFQDNKWTHFGSSLFAGFLGSCFSQPIDVAKTRMMNQKLLKNPNVGIFNLFLKLIKRTPTLWYNIFPFFQHSINPISPDITLVLL